MAPPYGAGTNDLPKAIAMAKRLRDAGIDWMLNFHYSDFWADPGKLFDWTGQNMLFTLAIGLVMLYGLRLFAAGRGVKLLIVLAAVIWSVLMKNQFGLCMVLLIAVYYLLKDHKAKLWVSGAISLMYVTGPLSNFVLKRYNHQPGEQPGRYLFYILYPLYLLILGVITRCVTAMKTQKSEPPVSPAA